MFSLRIPSSCRHVVQVSFCAGFSSLLLVAGVVRGALASEQVKPSWVGDSDKLPVFPKPFPEKAFPELKVLQPDGSPYRVPQEDWAGARERVAKDAGWKTWLAGEQRQADRWMAHHRDRAEWRAGWWHAFVSPKDGSFLVWTEKIPGEETGTLKSRAGHDVAITPAIMGGWVYVFRGRHIRTANTAAAFFRLTGEERYAEWAAAQLDFYAANYLGWSLQNGARMAGQSLEEAIWLIRLADTARLLRDWKGVTPARWQTWVEKLLRPQATLLNDSYQAIHNIATWHRSASAQVALLLDDGPMWRQAVESQYGLRAQLARGVTTDYFWYEQSMGYNNYIVSAVEPLLTFAGLLGRRDALREEAAIVQNLLLAPLAIRFPDNTLPNPADATSRPRVPSTWLCDGYRVLPTTLGLKQAESVRSWNTLLDPPWKAPGSAEMPPVESRRMDGSRFALLAKGKWQVFLHCGQVGRPHAQDEALNWSASFDGVDVTHDPGTVGYASALHRDYFKRGLTHNVPLINGEGQQPWKPGELREFDAARGVMTAEQPDYRNGALARRTLRIEGARLIDEATVRLKKDGRDGKDGKAGGALGLALHLQGKVTLPADFQPVATAAFSRNRPAAFRYWNDVRSATFENRAEFVVELAGGKRLRVSVATPGRFTVYQGASPDTPRPAQRAGFYIEREGRADEATFTTELSPVQ
ncbi:heparinase [Opitutaceae bacterium TAV5]|nr:heparinase [Opitutaceae bacterium TAV5]